MSRLSLIGAVLVSAVALMLSLVGTASAHSSSYCGHGTQYSGLDKVAFVTHYNQYVGSQLTHVHVYDHYFWNFATDSWFYEERVVTYACAS